MINHSQPEILMVSAFVATFTTTLLACAFCVCCTFFRWSGRNKRRKTIMGACNPCQFQTETFPKKFIRKPDSPILGYSYCKVDSDPPPLILNGSDSNTKGLSEEETEIMQIPSSFQTKNDTEDELEGTEQEHWSTENDLTFDGDPDPRNWESKKQK